MAISPTRIVNITESLQPAVTATRGFDKTLFVSTPVASDDLSETKRNAEVRSYAGLDQLASDWGNTSDVYEAAAVYFSQSPYPGQFTTASYFPSGRDGMVVGGTVAITQANARALGSSASFSLMGISLTADFSAVTDPASIATAVQTGINANAAFTGVTVEASTGAVIATDHNYTVEIPETLASATGADVSRGIEGLTALGLDGVARYARPFDSDASVGDALTRAVSADPTVYWITLSRDLMTRTTSPLPSATITAVATWVEGRRYMFGFDVQGAGTVTPNEAASVSAALFALDRTRSYAFWTSDVDYKALSMAGRFSSADYGGIDSTIVGGHRQLPGTTPDNAITPTQANELERKNVNYYTSVLGGNSVLYGTAFSGYIDRRVWLDWLVETIQTRVIGLLRADSRVPLTTAGSAQIASVVNSVCEQGVSNGGFSPGSVTEAVAGTIRNRTGNDGFDGYLSRGYLVHVAPQELADTANRIAPPIYVWGLYSGGVDRVNVNITIDG